VPKDETVPQGKWEFDQSVTDVFDDMLARSIPAYNEMRRLTTALAVANARKGGVILDLGCSRGSGLKPIIDKLGSGNRYIGVEISKPMVDAVRERFAVEISDGVVSIQHLDLRHEFVGDSVNVTIIVLTLQFVPVEYRQSLLRRVYQATEPNGVVLIVEKILGSSGWSQDTFVELYLDHKSSNGYTKTQIEEKRKSLEGVLVPLSSEANVSLLESAGFQQVECYWRWLNFAAWMGRKGRD
jgi:tRNA (cmo5U34)-methyltransferase